MWDFWITRHWNFIHINVGFLPKQRSILLQPLLYGMQIFSSNLTMMLMFIQTANGKHRQAIYAVASFDWSCSGICRSSERIMKVHKRCGEVQYICGIEREREKEALQFGHLHFSRGWPKQLKMKSKRWSEVEIASLHQ